MTDRAPGLAVVLAGEDPASASYVRSKTKACQEAGIVSRQLALPETVAQADLLHRRATVPYFTFQTGLRFSRNAREPSAPSSVSAISWSR